MLAGRLVVFATHHAKPMGINSFTRNYIPELKIVPSNLTIFVCKWFSNLFANNSMTIIFSVDDPSKWRAIAGRNNKEGIEANNQIRNISKIIRFPNPSSNILDKDLSLVKFDKPLDINTYVSPICLPTREPNVDDYCVVVGWGETRGEYICLFILQ